MVIPEFNIHAPEFFNDGVSLLQAATRMLHNFVFLCILYRCLNSSRITTCDLGKEMVMNDILSCNSKMILSCKSRLLHRAWATGYKIYWEENVIFL